MFEVINLYLVYVLGVGCFINKEKAGEIKDL
jgi:hypothetical protein